MLRMSPWLPNRKPPANTTKMCTLRPLSTQLQEKAKKELNENPNSTGSDINAIKEWLDKQPHLKAKKDDDQLILTFLRGSKFSLERTKERLDMFYTMRTLLPEFFKNRDPFLPQLQQILKLGLFLPLPQPTPEGERVILIRTAKDMSKFNLADAFKLYGMIVDILVNEDDNFIVAGVQAATDLKNSSTANMVYLNPVVIKKFLKCFQEAYPLRPKGLVFFNAPSFFETLYNLFKSFLSEKLKKRVTVFTDENVTLEAVPKAVLPKDYGGESDSVAEITEHWKRKVESYQGWFKENEKYFSVESKRPGRPKTSDNVFGVDGSFRKLDVD